MSEKETFGDIHNATLAHMAKNRANPVSPAQAIAAEAREDAEDRAVAAESTLAATRAGFDSAMAAVVAERDEVIRQRGEALGRVVATVDALEAAEKREAEAHAEIDALDRALSAAGLPPAETLAGRVAGLQMMRAEALSEARALTTERDNCREVLRREREERAAEKATMGAALDTLRTKNASLEVAVTELRTESTRLVAQRAILERVIVAGLRG